MAAKTAVGAAAPGGAEPAEAMESAGGDGERWLGRRRRLAYSSSAASVPSASTGGREQLRHHNVFLASADACRGLFDAAESARWDERIASAPMHFYVHAPARTDGSCVEAPTDDAVMVLVPVPPLDERLSESEAGAATERIVARAREAVVRTFEAAGMEGFGDAVVDERVRTPPGGATRTGCGEGRSSASRTTSSSSRSRGRRGATTPCEGCTGSARTRGRATACRSSSSAR